MATVIGITGGIATGKSAVAAMFGEFGAETVDADEVARAVLSPGSDIVSEIECEFGSDVIAADGSIDRARLGRIVFADPAALERLNLITHPPIVERLNEIIREFRDRSPDCAVLAVEIPLLIEANLMAMVDKIVLVVAEQEAQQNRLRRRGSLSEDQIGQRILSQMTMEEKIPYADWIVTTVCSVEETKMQVLSVWEAIGNICRDSGV